jgi:NitT/TauT family transport system substrate-binding protein
MRRKFAACVVPLLAVAALAGCGGSEEESAAGSDSAPAAEKVTEVKASVLAAASLAPMYAGIKHGFFKEEGIDFKPEAVAPPAVVPAVMSGASKMGWLAIPSILLAKSQGLPLKIVAHGGGNTFNPVLVKEDSPIKSYADLGGKRVAIPNFGGLGEYALTGALLRAGVNPKDVKMVEVPFPDMDNALRRGRVDAFWTIQPFLALAENKGGVRSLGSSSEAAGDAFKNLAAYYFVTDDTLKKDKDLITRFERAAEKSADYGIANWDEMVELVPTFAEVPKEALSRDVVESYFGEIPIDSIQKLADFMLEQGWLKNKVDAQELVWTPDEA